VHAVEPHAEGLGAERILVGDRAGHAADTVEALEPICDQIGVGDVAAAISADAVKLELAQNGEKAIALGIFGVPTLEIDGHLFWGNDATGMALAYLADGTLFDDDEMRRGDTLPAAAQRNVPRDPTRP
jgi:hypothetical protein